MLPVRDISASSKYFNVTNPKRGTSLLVECGIIDAAEPMFDAQDETRKEILVKGISAPQISRGRVFLRSVPYFVLRGAIVNRTKYC